MIRLNIEKMPVLPQVMSGILRLGDDNDTSFSDLEKLIQADMTVSTMILKVANSPLYARNGSIKSLKQAIALLGFKLVRSMVVLASTKSIFADGKYEKFRKYVWKHSIVTAILAKAVGQRKGSNRNIQEEAFVGGLLHDIGKVILNAHDRKLFIEAMNLSLEKEISFVEAEQKLFGFDHQMAGKAAVQKWNLPYPFDIIAGSHENLAANSINGDVKENEVFYLAAYANHISKLLGYGHKGDIFSEDAAILESKLNITAEDRKFFLQELPPQLKQDEFFKFCVTLV